MGLASDAELANGTASRRQIRLWTRQLLRLLRRVHQHQPRGLPKAVSNAALSFSSRLEAAKAPGRLADRRDIDIALGLIAENQHVNMATARERLRAIARWAYPLMQRRIFV